MWKKRTAFKVWISAGMRIRIRIMFGSWVRTIIRILASSKGSKLWKSTTQIGSYSIHLGLSSANWCGFGSRLSLWCVCGSSLSLWCWSGSRSGSYLSIWCGSMRIRSTTLLRRPLVEANSVVCGGGGEGVESTNISESNFMSLSLSVSCCLTLCLYQVYWTLINRPPRLILTHIAWSLLPDLVNLYGICSLFTRI